MNKNILEDHNVSVSYSDLDEAKKQGAKALFSEKYTQEVRVVRMGGSIELCGGTHVTRSSQIGLFILLGERGIASGVRRIEAITGMKALEYVKTQRQLLENSALLIKGTPEELPQKIEHLQQEKREMQQEMRQLKDQAGNDIIKDMISEKINLDGLSVYIKAFKEESKEDLKNLSDQIQAQDPQGLILLFSTKDAKIAIVAAAGDKARSLGYKAGRIVSKIAKELGGGGGGRDHFATAGAKNVEKLTEIISNIQSILIEVKE